MLTRTDLRGRTLTDAQLRAMMPRGGSDPNEAMKTVATVVDEVHKHGAAAALKYGEKFDGVASDSVRVPAKVIADALASLEPAVKTALEAAIERIRKVHAAQVPKEHTVTVAPGGEVTEKWIPINRVGLYVPGGKAVYPSSVVMNVVPAQEAGVNSLVVASPPQKEHGGWPHPTILAACAILGVDEVWSVGGAQAVALMAYGGEDTSAADTPNSELEPVDLITGPGNVFVTAAKRLVRGVVGIDAEAGPSEIAILADETANASFVAADMISQAEHDPLAASVLITDSQELADMVDDYIVDQAGEALSKERINTALAGPQSGIILVDDMEQGVQVANAYAAEHLEVHTADARAVAERIVNAGAIFVGPYTPVPLGDYAAGSNHVLPTCGSARYSAGLSTHTFLKPVHLVEYDKEALSDIADAIVTLAEEEVLPAHGTSIQIRQD
ncbi:MAG: histidinol dehydrogenase [Lawsonella sp.]